MLVAAAACAARAARAALRAGALLPPALPPPHIPVGISSCNITMPVRRFSASGGSGPGSGLGVPSDDLPRRPKAPLSSDEAAAAQAQSVSDPRAQEQQLKQRQQEEQQPHEEEQGQAKGVVEEAADTATEMVAKSLSALHPRITKLMQSGFMESARHLQERMITERWDKGGSLRAAQRGVAEFEALCADKGLPVDFDLVTRLYEDPEGRALSDIADPHVRMLARATIRKVVYDKYEQALEGCAQTSLELTEKVTTGGTGSSTSGLVELLRLIPGVKWLLPK